MIAGEAVSDIRIALHDPDGVRFSDDVLLLHLTRAQRQVVMIRPDANSYVECVKLTAQSTKQEVPDQGRFIGLVRNVKADGSPGTAITSVERSSLDDSNLLWHMEPPSEVIDNYAFEEKVPTVYWVTPPPAEEVRVELEYSRRPGALIHVEQEMALSDIFLGPIVNYVLYLCLAVNSTSATNWQKGMDNLRQMYVSLGEEAKARLFMSPNVNKQGGGNG
ncbi:DUF6682 family protein [Maridesulfovibrio ferrireducens]|uniref:phage adaptor protein n=1 Tax=Maridesulfovibrio ferrireducens TaxID=246191 RepID=UPI001A1EECA2|nr:DUF6682 family protein [Maridesulfovibrio ferrireducens]MBI9110321.1 hypothetical protein [Maridesulfovibrio ferrireducens]